MEQQAIKIIRKTDVIKMSGLSKSTIQNRINDSLMPPGISLGARAVGFLEHEIKSVLAAMINGKTEDELQALVKSLVNQRIDLEE